MRKLGRSNGAFAEVSWLLAIQLEHDWSKPRSRPMGAHAEMLRLSHGYRSL
jgi:hypothetical protein